LIEFLGRVGETKGGILKTLLQSPGMIRAMLTKKLMSSPTTRAGVTDTIHVTGFGGANLPNVVPSEVWANVDCRLLPGTTPAMMLDRLKDLVKDVPDIRFEVLSEKSANASPWEDPFFEALAKSVVDGKPDHVAGPVLSVGFTDSLFLREVGVNAYGLVPFEVGQEEMTGMHGHNERVSVENVQGGVRRLYGAVLEVSR
jgi:acetylornithine deacetylase/succinyl-diaminopimelate desuccinylase-like protein